MERRCLCKYVISDAVVDDYRFLAIVFKQELTRWRISISGEPSNEELSWIASTYSRPLDEKEREIDRQMEGNELGERGTVKQWGQLRW